MSKPNSILHDKRTIVDEFDDRLSPWERLIQVRDYEMDWEGFSEYLSDADRKVRSFEQAYR